MITQQWHIVILNIVLFLLFLIPLSFRRKIDWKEYGLVTAFFISLFVEMYGIPLTIFLASKSLTGSEIVIPNSIVDFEFLGVGIRMTHAMLYGTILMVIGTFLIIMGWVTLFKNIQDNNIVTIGIYAYSRHPQYFGFVFIILGWIIGWPSILAVIFGIILIFVYIRVSMLEEKELSHLKEYQGYKKKVPFFI
jgi:protein-S-isoprenylcysteine O-methyltransferase Ste14